MFKSSPQTEMFTNDKYTQRVVGYLKVLSQSGNFDWFGVNYEGNFITKKDTVDAYMPSDYILDTAAPTLFGERTGLTITKPEFDIVISQLKNRTDYKTLQLGTVPAVVPSVSSAADSDDTTIFNLLKNPNDIAFFLVDLTTNRLYTCTKDGNKFIVKWNEPIPVVEIPSARWSNVWSYIPFCTVTNLSAPKDGEIDFYPRTKTKLTGDKFKFDDAPPNYKKIPPPFNLVIYSLGPRKTFQEVLAAVKNKLGAAPSTEVSNVSETNNRQLAFVRDLKDIGCNGDSSLDYILDAEKCVKITALMEKLKPPTTGGRRSKRNKRRRNKRTVSHRGRGHKRSRRVDGGSRKCGKKCRRKHTRK
jgi:hypothetical protein